MKVRRDDTEDARRYWEFLDANAKIVSEWPEWKRGVRLVLEDSSPAHSHAGDEGDRQGDPDTGR